MSEELKQHILKNGLNLGLILVAITLFTYTGGAELATSYFVSFGSLLLMIIFPIYYTRKFRAQNDGYISFREAFSSCTGILIAAGFLNTFVSILIYNVIDPGFALEMLDAIIEKTVTQFESGGMDEAQIEQAVKLIEEGSDFSAMSMFKGYIFGIIFYTIFGLIVAAITKNDRPEFIED
jgi:hypothetical protein